MGWILVSLILGVSALLLLCRLLSVRKAMKEIAQSLHGILHTDTNALITTNVSDSAVCELADALNRELKDLRRERLQVENGTHELQTAVTNIAHDLRTPLTALSGYLELLQQEALSESGERYLSVICERTETLKNLTEELFRFSVTDTTTEELSLQRLSLNRELELALAGAYQMLSERGIEPEISLPEQSVERKLNSAALQRVFGNILTNAVKYSSGDLSVSLSEDGELVFSNTAPMLSEIEVGRLFDRYYTVENAKDSTGLGLSIARLLTERMGGSIHARLENRVLSIALRF